jgi:hypothetical protein
MNVILAYKNYTFLWFVELTLSGSQLPYLYWGKNSRESPQLKIEFSKGAAVEPLWNTSEGGNVSIWSISGTRHQGYIHLHLCILKSAGTSALQLSISPWYQPLIIDEYEYYNWKNKNLQVDVEMLGRKSCSNTDLSTYIPHAITCYWTRVPGLWSQQQLLELWHGQ